MSDVEAVVQVAVGGRAFTQMVEGEKLFDIVLRLPKHQRDDPEVIDRIPVDTPGQDGKPGARIPLKQLAKIDPHKPGAAYIYRENNRRYIPIKFSVQGRDLASTIAEAKRKVKDPQHGANLPNGYDIDWSGEFEQMEEANGRLLWIVPISIGLIMILLYTAFSVDQGRAPGHGQRDRSDDGRSPGALAHGYAVLHLGCRGLRVGLRRGRAGWRAPDLLLQPDARGRLAGARGGDAGGRAARPAGRHDVA